MNDKDRKDWSFVLLTTLAGFFYIDGYLIGKHGAPGLHLNEWDLACMFVLWLLFFAFLTCLRRLRK